MKLKRTTSGIAPALALAVALVAPGGAHAQGVPSPTPSATPAPAQPAPAPVASPTSEEVKKVIDYFYNGKEKGPILTELKPCLAVDTKKDSTTRWDCLEPVSGTVKKGTAVHAWMSWFVPQEGKYEDLAVQWVHEGQVRTTQDLPLTQATWRARTYRTHTLSKAGKWELKIMRGSQEIKTVAIQVE